MAAYAALVSLFNNLDQIQNHPRFSASINKYQIKSLVAHIDFLLDFVESYNVDGGRSKGGAEELRSQIASAAHKAEDIIESHIEDIILPGTTEISGVRLHRRCFFGLQKVIQDMYYVKEKVLKIKERSGFNYWKPVASSMSLTTEQNSMVGFEDELMQLKDVLIGQQSSRQIVSIVGMGGTGKTTLAKNVYEDSLTRHHFDLRAWATISQDWATISQDHGVRQIFLQLLSVAEGTLKELEEKLHKNLFGKRYLIVLDDIWSMEVWDRIKFFFPDTGDGSRIVLTTRLSNMATHLSSICVRINFLDEYRSWNLFCQKVFGKEHCPTELEGIGKKIVEKCKGLPLSIVVTGGLLKKSHRTEEHWQSVAKNINAIFDSREYGECLDLLYLSYTHLPAHLKPCFLYMGTFKEDSEIRVSEIIKLWVAEGFLKPNNVQILEEMAEDYLKDIIDRNLILVCGRRSNGRIKSVRIHDLLRELCLRVAEKEEFFCVVEPNSIPRGINRERRLIFDQTSSYLENEVKTRVLNRARFWPLEAELQNVNLRYIACQLSPFFSLISLMWNLQTLIIGRVTKMVAPLEIWEMTQLRHLKCDQLLLSDPPPSDDKDESIVLRNLQTLSVVLDFRLSEEARKRIPNIKKLHMKYGFTGQVNDDTLFDNLQNLDRLQRLESLYVLCFHKIPIRRLKYTLPSSLKKLFLGGHIFCYEDLPMIIDSLPQLEVLKLREASDRLKKWSCDEGECLRLKFLSIDDSALESWTLDRGSYFPVLEKLVLNNLHHLDEIPSGIREIPTLQLIRLENCTASLVISAMKIKEERESFGYYDLQIQVKMLPFKREGLMERVKVEGLSINNIHLEIQRNLYFD